MKVFIQTLEDNEVVFDKIVSDKHIQPDELLNKFGDYPADPKKDIKKFAEILSVVADADLIILENTPIGKSAPHIKQLIEFVATNAGKDLLFVSPIVEIKGE